MTMAKNKPVAEFKPIRDRKGNDISPRFLRNALKIAAQREQRLRTWKTIKRQIGTLSGRQRTGYAQQVDAMYEAGLVLMWLMNLASGYAHVSLMELASLTNTKTKRGDYVGLGRMHRALKTFKALRYIDYKPPLLNPQGGGRDRIRIMVNPSLFVLFGIRESAVMAAMRSALDREIALQKKRSESGYGLPPETLDALANPKQAACLIGWWQWYRYTKATFRRFVINVRRAGLFIHPPAAPG